jgi:preprotein translocase SecE subunit
MAAGIYKPGQGYWTRMMSAIAFGLLILQGVVWLWDQLRNVRIGDMEIIYVQAIGAVLAVGIFGGLAFYYLGRNQRFVDFLIATEGEMKKVNWSTRREILGFTRLVIFLTLLIAVLCFGIDNGFIALFDWVGILKFG